MVDYLDKIQQNRANSAKKKLKDFETHKTLATLRDLKKGIVESVKQEASETRKTTQTVKVLNNDYATKSDIKQLTSVVEDLIITQYASGKKFVESQEELYEEIAEAIADIVLPDNSPLTEKLESVVSAVRAIPKQLEPKDRTDEVLRALNDVKTAIGELNIAPVVNMPAVKAEKPQKIDLTPIVDALNKEESKEIELEDYRVTQSIEPYDGLQYFLFVHPSGTWYILFNDAENSTILYHFGKSDYKEAWKKYDTLDYLPIDEATNAIRD